MATLRKKINQQIGQVPQYNLQPEYAENQNIAKARAFGRPAEIQMQEQNLDQSESDALAQAKDYSSSTSGLLATLAAIEGNKQGAYRGLAQQEAQIKSQNTNDLYNANQAMAEERDKQWYQNVYAPWDLKLKQLQQKKANRDNFWTNVVGGIISGAGQVGSALATGGASAAAKVATAAG